MRATHRMPRPAPYGGRGTAVGCWAACAGYERLDVLPLFVGERCSLGAERRGTRPGAILDCCLLARNNPLWSTDSWQTSISSSTEVPSGP